MFCYRLLPWSLFELCHQAASQQNTTVWLCCERVGETQRESEIKKEKEKCGERMREEVRKFFKALTVVVMYCILVTVLQYQVIPRPASPLLLRSGQYYYVACVCGAMTHNLYFGKCIINRQLSLIYYFIISAGSHLRADSACPSSLSHAQNVIYCHMMWQWCWEADLLVSIPKTRRGVSGVYNLEDLFLKAPMARCVF